MPLFLISWFPGCNGKLGCISKGFWKGSSRLFFANFWIILFQTPRTPSLPQIIHWNQVSLSILKIANLSKLRLFTDLCHLNSLLLSLRSLWSYNSIKHWCLFVSRVSQEILKWGCKNVSDTLSWLSILQQTCFTRIQYITMLTPLPWADNCHRNQGWTRDRSLLASKSQ